MNDYDNAPDEILGYDHGLTDHPELDFAVRARIPPASQGSYEEEFDRVNRRFEAGRDAFVEGTDLFARHGDSDSYEDYEEGYQAARRAATEDREEEDFNIWDYQL